MSQIYQYNNNTVYGTLTIAGESIPSAEVVFYQVNSDTMVETHLDTDTTDKNGQWNINIITSGHYTIKFYGKGASASDWIIFKYFAFDAGAGALTWVGDWTVSTDYYINDVVYYTVDGSSYVCGNDHTSTASGANGPPDDPIQANWTMMAAAGEDGENGITGLLTNESHTVPADFDGGNPDLTDAKGTFKVFEGTEDITTCAWVTFSKPANEAGTTAVIDSNTGVYCVTGMTNDAGWADYQANYCTGTLLIDKKFSLAKSNAGVGGSDSKNVKLYACDYQISYNQEGCVPVPSSICFTTDLYYFEDTPYYEFFVDGSSCQGPSVTDNYNYTVPTEYNLTPDFWKSSVIKVETRDGGAACAIESTDTLSIFGTKEGEDTVIAFLTNEAHTLPATKDGDAVYDGSGTEVHVYQGNEALTPDATPIAGEYCVSVDTATCITAGAIDHGVTTPGVVTVADHSAMTADNANILYEIGICTNEGASHLYNKEQSFAKSKRGDNGPGIVYRGEFSTADSYAYDVFTRDVVTETGYGDYYVSEARYGLAPFLGSTSGLPHLDSSCNYWESFGATFSSISTGIILSEYSVIKCELAIASGGRITMWNCDGATTSWCGLPGVEITDCGIRAYCDADNYATLTTGGIEIAGGDISVRSGTCEFIGITPSGHADVGTQPAFYAGACTKFGEEATIAFGGDGKIYGSGIYTDGTCEQLIEKSRIFGDGSDGNCIVSSQTCLTRDMYYKGLCVYGDGTNTTICTCGFRIFVSDLLQLRLARIDAGGGNGGAGGDGTSEDGNGGTVGTAGTGFTGCTGHTLADGVDGVTGRCGGDGAVWGGASADPGIAGCTGNGASNMVIAANGCLVGCGGAGGTGAGGCGGAGSAAGGGGGGTGSGGQTNIQHIDPHILLVMRETYSNTAAATPLTPSVTGGSGGSAGGGGAGKAAGETGSGGGGSGGSGGSGGHLMISARCVTLFDNCTSSLHSNGGNGGAGGDGPAAVCPNAGDGGGGGGGAGGNGGVTTIITNTYLSALTNLTIAANGGTGGSLGTSVDGQDGCNGCPGRAGVVIKVEI